MTAKQNTAAVTLLILLVAAVYGVIRTDGAPAAALAAAKSAADSSGVDQSSLNVVRDLIHQPTSAEEVGLAQDAFRIADQEMDLAFGDAVRDAATRPKVSTPEVISITARLQQAQKELAADEAEMTADSVAVAKAGPTTVDRATDAFNLEKAHVALHHDEVDDAHQDLITAGGDPQGRMQAMVAEHEASSRSSDSTRIVATAPPEAIGLIHRAQAWWDLREKTVGIQNAKLMAETAAATLATKHAALEKAATAAPSLDSDDATAGLSHEALAAMLRTTQRRANDNKARSSMDQHVENQHRLAAVYVKWAAAVGTQQRVQVNFALRGIASILFILLFGLVLDRWIEHSLGAMSMDRRRLHTLMMVVRVSIQVIGALLILLVIFGPPNNLGTFLGLAGAGLTVALKDFIIGFIGWFVLMGNDGIRMGDMVEINGVTGEVVELAMFHTVLLETGSWSDAGHLTGRRVTFTNSFAIEGHYFNFSSSGQWLWDEVRLVVPSGRDPYPIADTLKTQVEAATAKSARAAEEHWKGARRSPHFTALTAAPSVNVKPVSGGVEITLRYITHVTERSDVRANLYRTAVDLLSAGHAQQPAESNAPAPASTKA
ncbi:MAG: mechanosensitive ion channel domain-containing protein [Gemmatimonadaceae bacterium]